MKRSETFTWQSIGVWCALCAGVLAQQLPTNRQVPAQALAQQVVASQPAAPKRNVNPAPAGKASGYLIEVAQVNSQVEAEHLVARLKTKQLAAHITPDTSQTPPSFRIRLDQRYATETQANAAASKLLAARRVQVYIVLPAQVDTPTTPATEVPAVAAVPVTATTFTLHPQALTTNDTAPPAMKRSVGYQPRPTTELETHALTGNQSTVLPGAAATAVAPVGTQSEVTADAIAPPPSSSEAMPTPATSPRQLPVVSQAPPQTTIMPELGQMRGLSGHALPALASKATAPAPTVTPTRAPVRPQVPVREVEIDELAEAGTAQLESKVAPEDGRLVLHLANRSTRRSFRGSVRLTLKDAGHVSVIDPWQFTLAPKQETPFDLNARVSQSGMYLVSVYDENGALQLMKAASLAPKRPANAEPAATAKPEIATNADGTRPVGISVDVPVSTGAEEEASGAKDLVTSSYPGGKAQAEQEEKGAPETPAPGNNNQAGEELKVTARLVSISTESATLEFEINAAQPLGRIMVSLQTASASDHKDAIMTGKYGRVPFIVPINDTNGAFRFELKDDSGRLLAVGQRNFQDLKKP